MLQFPTRNTIITLTLLLLLSINIMQTVYSEREVGICIYFIFRAFNAGLNLFLTKMKTLEQQPISLNLKFFGFLCACVKE